jgi:hypothetical protein
MHDLDALQIYKDLSFSHAVKRYKEAFEDRAYNATDSASSISIFNARALIPPRTSDRFL